MGCHLAGACPQEKLDITPWAEATARWLLRHPYSQRLPRKFKINFSGCATDCGQAMFNDVGVIATTRTLADGTEEAGFQVFVAGGLGANPHPAQALEEFTVARGPAADDRGVPAHLRPLRQPRQQDPRPHEVARRHDGHRRAARADHQGAQVPARRARLAGRHPRAGTRAWATRPRAASRVAPTGTIKGVPVKLLSTDPYGRWQEANVVRGIAKGTTSVMAYARLGDITTEQFRALAQIQRDFQLDVRVTNRQNFALRDVAEADLRGLYDRLADIGMAEPGAELARDVVACPGADTCNLAVTQSRGLAAAIGDALETAGLAEVPGVRVNISGCTNSCGQHHISDIGFFGLERRAHGRAAPGYQMLLGGHVGDMQIEFGDKASKLPAKSAPEAVVRIVGRFNEERQPGEEFAQWLARSGGAKGVGETVNDLDHFPTPDVGPEFFVDYGETGPYVAEIGDGECAT